MARIMLGLLLVLCSLTLAGCNGARETDEIAWVIAIGLDRASDGDLLVTYRIAVPAAMSPTESGGAKDKKPTAAITVKAPTFAEARNLLNEVSSRSVNISHVAVVTIGEDLARVGIGDIMASLIRSHEIRESIYLNLARGGTAKELFEKNKPDLELFPTRWIENVTFHKYGETSFILPNTLHSFITRLKSETGSPYSLAIAVNKSLKLRDDQAETTAPDTKEKEYLAGTMPREGGNPVENLGTAIFKEDRLVDFLSGEETRALAIVLDLFGRGVISVEDPLLPHYAVDIIFRNGTSPEINVDISGEVPVIDIAVYLEGQIQNIPSGIAYEKPEYLSLLSAQLSNAIKAQIEKMLTHTQSHGADVVDFGYFIRHKFKTRNELMAYHWDERFRKAVFHVTVKNDIRRNGLMQNTSPFRREHEK